MDTATPHNPIKPLLTHTIHIKSLYTYNNFLIKRPKSALTFKFSRQGFIWEDDTENQIKAERKLHKTLRLIKSAQKVDLSNFQVKGEKINQDRFQSSFKTQSISKASTLYLTKHQHYSQLGAKFAENPLKYLSKLRNLVFEMTSELREWTNSNKGPCEKDPLRYLRCCPKLESLKIDMSKNDYVFSKLFPTFHTYSASLKNLKLEFCNNHKEKGSVLPLKKSPKLESVYFSFHGKMNQSSFFWNIDGLSSLPRLQEMSLEFHTYVFPEIHMILEKMIERKMLTKIRLIFPEYVPVKEETVKVFSDFDQLTDFELNLLVQDDNALRTLSECLDKMKKLNALRLTISKKLGFESFDALKTLCQKISELHFLRHLHLSFLPIKVQHGIPNFILMCGHLQLETLSLIYTQAYPSQSLLYLFTALKSSSNSLRKLKVSFGAFSPSQQSQEAIIKFLASLSNIEVLELIRFDIEDDDFLGKFVQAINSLIYLRELTMREFKGKVTFTAYENALTAILSKRGLRKFESQAEIHLLARCKLFVGSEKLSPPCGINMKAIERNNPFLENIKISENLHIRNLLQEVANWE